MSLKKKKNIIILTFCVVMSFILYQLFFFFTITSETSIRSKVVPVFEHEDIIQAVHIRTEHDKFLNNDGVIKGVFYAQMPKYRPTSKNEFKCLKSDQKIAFEDLNNDFCDCEDGTDEPSTNACPNGTFFCQTHHKKVSVQEVPSSKVNDGICDCCDGSDEWLHSNRKLLSQSNQKHYRYYVTKCPNNC